MFTFISMKFAGAWGVCYMLDCLHAFHEVCWGLGCVLHVSMCMHSMKFAGACGVCYM